MIVKGLTGNTAFLYQVFNCDFVYAFFASHFEKGMGNFFFQIFSQVYFLLL